MARRASFPALARAGGLYGRLRAAAEPEWTRYVDHEFVRALGAGTLPEKCFRHYLQQDYLFLVHFARAYGLAAYKASDLADMRAAGATLNGLVNTELSLHVRLCASWGLSERALAAVPEAPANMAYTRYVLERGAAGDLLDLLVALAPCVVGYGEIARRLMASRAVRLKGNRYREWLEAYAGPKYQGIAQGAVRQIERVGRARLGASGADLARHPRFAALAATFREATRLEIGFWDMGLEPAGKKARS